jgi:hypothetical protein
MGEGPRSDTYDRIPLGLPGSPLSVTVKMRSGSTEISWTAPEKTGGSPILNYTIYRSFNKEKMVKVGEVAGNILSYTDRDPKPGSYSYKVAAINAQGEGQQSSEAILEVKEEKGISVLLLLIVGIVIFFIIVCVLLVVLLIKRRDAPQLQAIPPYQMIAPIQGQDFIPQGALQGQILQPLPPPPDLPQPSPQTVTTQDTQPNPEVDPLTQHQTEQGRGV